MPTPNLVTDVHHAASIADMRAAREVLVRIYMFFVRSQAGTWMIEVGQRCSSNGNPGRSDGDLVRRVQRAAFVPLKLLTLRVTVRGCPSGNTRSPTRTRLSVLERRP